MVDEMAERSPHSPRVARKRRARMQQILRTALELSASEGREALTLKRLGERLDLTTTALYRYFPSKDALVAELQRAVIRSLSATTRERVEQAATLARARSLPDDERALLAVTVAAFTFEAFARTSPVEFGFLAMDLSSPDYTLPEREAAAVFEEAWAALGELAAWIEEAAASDAIDAGDASERAVGLWASLQGAVQTRKLTRSAGERVEPMRLARGLVATLLVGWGADRDAVANVTRLASEDSFAKAPPSTLDFLDALAA